MNEIKYSSPNSQNKKKPFRIIQTSTKGMLTIQQTSLNCQIFLENTIFQLSLWLTKL